MGIFRVSFKPANSLVAYCALSVKTGTRNENPLYNGMAHLVEHMLFKGTAKRSSKSINNLIEKEGGELNAYTTKEEIVIYSTILSEDLPKAVDLLLELALTSIFPQKELDKELSVIYDEIISYKDSPGESVYDEFESELFRSHPLGMPILGEKKSLRHITPALLADFLKSHFTPENMVLTVVSRSDRKGLERMVSRSLAKYSTDECAIEFVDNGDNVSSVPDNGEFPDLANRPLREFTAPFKIEKVKRNHQAHCVIGATAYSFYHGWRRAALTLLANIIGGPSTNATLNLLLREKYALVYNVEASYTPYSDTGIFAVYFGCDKSYLGRCKELVYEELKRFVEAPLSEKDLKRAKKQFLGQLYISSDNAETQCLSMGKSIMVFGKVYPYDYSRNCIESITSEQLQCVAKEVLAGERLSELVFK